MVQTRKAVRKGNRQTGNGNTEVSSSDILNELERAGIVDEEQLEVASELVRLRNKLGGQTRTTHAGGIEQITFRPTNQLLTNRQSNRKQQVKPTAAVLASRKLQGRYIGMLVKVPKAQRKRFQKLAKTEGREKAIKQMAKVIG